jgi:hypothetical protein
MASETGRFCPRRMPGASFFQSGILTHPNNDPPFPKPSFLAVITDLAPNSQKIAKWQYQSLKMRPLANVGEIR